MTKKLLDALPDWTFVGLMMVGAYLDVITYTHAVATIAVLAYLEAHRAGRSAEERK